MLEELLRKYFGLIGPLCDQAGRYTVAGYAAYSRLLDMLGDLGQITDRLPLEAIVQDLDRIEEEEPHG